MSIIKAKVVREATDEQVLASRAHQAVQVARCCAAKVSIGRPLARFKAWDREAVRRGLVVPPLPEVEVDLSS